MQRFDRRFRIWEYWVSHSQLLLRSPGDLRCPADSSRSRNVDVIFVSVSYIELPAIMWDLELTDPTMADLQKAEQVLGEPVQPEHVFVIVANGRRYLVVAGGMQILENNLELMQSSLERV